MKKNKKHQTVLITGGAGFIASHIADTYLKLGHKVTIVDNLFTGQRKNINPKTKFYKTDIYNKIALENIFKKERPDIINHHAAFANVALSVKQPKLVFQTNLIGTLNLLEFAVKYKIKKIIFSSTGGALYGLNPKPLPAKETNKLEPPSYYGLSKLFGEELIRLYSRLYNLNYTIFRYPNVYGPRQNPKTEAGVVAIFATQMLKNDRPIIFGNGEKTRDYVYIEDIIKANILALKKANGKTINIGWGKEIKDINIFNNVKKLLKSKIQPKFGKIRPGEALRISLDASLAKKYLGWTPKIKLEKGIKRTINFILENR